MSQRNGDKARFGRQRCRKISLRRQIRDLRKVLTGKTPQPTIAAVPSGEAARFAPAPIAS